MEVIDQKWTPTWRRLNCPDVRERACHSTVVLGDLLIGFAGWDGTKYHNDLIALDLNEMKWQKGQITGGVPIPRYTHTTNLYQDDKIIVVGGYSGGGRVLNETAIMHVKSTNPLSVEWEIIKPKQDKKLHRSDHSANILGKYLYLFGGADINEESTDELWLLNLETYAWTQLNPQGNRPGDRYGHCSVIHNDTLYIYGGLNVNSGLPLSDMWSINLMELKWQQINPAPNQQVMSPRYAGIAQLVNDKIYVFGGYTTEIYAQDLQLFDIKTQSWSTPNTKGKLPEGRAFHASAYHNNRLIIWGGEYKHTKCLFSIYACDLERPSQNQRESSLQALKEKEAVDTLNNIFETGEFTDIVFEVQGEEIPAHKAILAGGCRYFYNMFTSGMIESQAKKITISDADIPTFKAFLMFIYCQEINFSYPLAISLLGLAEKYSVLGLKEICEDFLAKELTKENMTELSNVAECFDADHLKCALLRFSKKNS